MALLRHLVVGRAYQALGFVLSDSEDAIARLGFVTGAAPGDECVSEGDIGEIDHDRVVDDAAYPGRPRYDGHFSHFYAKLWKPYLIEFLASLDPPQHAAAAE